METGGKEIDNKETGDILTGGKVTDNIGVRWQDWDRIRQTGTDERAEVVIEGVMRKVSVLWRILQLERQTKAK